MVVPNLVATRHLTVPLAAKNQTLADLRIAHVSDFHFRKWNRVVASTQKLLMALDYDLLVVTGDLGHWPRRWKRAVQITRRFFEPLADRYDIYAILGNHDNPAIAQSKELPLIFLRNESIVIEKQSGRYRLAGVEQLQRDEGDLEAALGSGWDMPTILLAHYPSTVYRLSPGRVALQLSGHTHGGQMRLPYLGCLWSNDRLPHRYAQGLNMVNGTALHVSAGIGTSLPIPLRFNCPPEVTILTFQSVSASAKETPTLCGAIADREQAMATSGNPD